MIRPKRSNDDPERVMVAGMFYHHLVLGIRITFERAYDLPDDLKYVVVCRNRIVCYAHSDSNADAKKAFKIIEESYGNKQSADTGGSETEWLDRQESKTNGTEGSRVRRKTSGRGIHGC